VAVPADALPAVEHRPPVGREHEERDGSGNGQEEEREDDGEDQVEEAELDVDPAARSLGGEARVAPDEGVFQAFGHRAILDRCD
jgi:hypothetical protein